MSHPITSQCFPSEDEASYSVELHDAATGELIDTVPVRSTEHELEVYNAQLARCEILAERDADFEPVTVSLLLGEVLHDQKKIHKRAQRETA